MPRARLTVKNVPTLPAINGKRTDYVDATLPGFVLRVSPTGARSYGLAVRHRGRKLRINLGKVGRVQLGGARDEAREMLRRLEHGQTPQPPRYLVGRQLTVAGLVERCLGELQLRPSTQREWGRLLKVEIGPAIGERLADDLGRSEIREWSRDLRKRSGYTANHAFALLRRAYSWARREELVTASPCDHMPMPYTAAPSERVLSAEELSALLRALERGQRRWPDNVDATRLLLLTGVRRAAVLGAQRDELAALEGRDPRWIVPGGLKGRSKSGRPQVVPLSGAALIVVYRRLEATAGPYLFPARGHRGAMTWSSQWRSWLRRRVERSIRARRRAAGRAAGVVPRWTIHGLRHTIATHLREDLAIAPDIVSLILGHTVAGPRISRLYDRAERLPERRRALEAWAVWLDALAGPEGGEQPKILPFGR